MTLKTRFALLLGSLLGVLIVAMLGLRQFETSAGSFRPSYVCTAFGLCLLALIGAALQAWVIRPLRLIEQCGATQDPAPLANLRSKPSEIGRIADLVAAAFEQRTSLQREIAERTRLQAVLAQTESALRENMEHHARLGRDLHDGVIQSLYAAGLGLAGLRQQLHPDQTDAALRLEQTRTALNATIHDLRSLLAGLEPESLTQRPFAEALAALLEAMGGAHAFRSQVEVDETLAARLTLAQRVHALQIAREAVSNAVRHGAASEIHVSLRSHGDTAEFQVADNGRGFDPASAPPGHGLANFATRARELDGNLSVESQPSHGTRVRLHFQLPLL